MYRYYLHSKGTQELMQTCRDMVESFEYQVETREDNVFRVYAKVGQLDYLEILQIVKGITDGQNKANLKRRNKRSMKWIYHFFFLILDERSMEIGFKSYKEYIQTL